MYNATKMTDLVHQTVLFSISVGNYGQGVEAFMVYIGLYKAILLLNCK